MRRILIGAIAVVLLAGGPAAAAEEGGLPAHKWSFTGPFGHFNRGALQRGFAVYHQICASCHGLELVAYRNLADIGFDGTKIAEIAAGAEVQDGPNEQGDMYMRQARPADRFVSPFPNENAARTANNGAYPPDLSLAVKARKDGSNYLYGLLTGFREQPPAGVKMTDGMYYNTVFPGHQIAMPPPLADDAVAYDDGTAASVEQMAEDVTVFLAWAAEPNLEARKRMGIKVLIFLVVLTGMLFALKRQVWSKLH